MTVTAPGAPRGVTAMYWYHGPGAWGWLAMAIGMLVFWAVVIGVGVLLFRALSRPGRSTPAAAPGPPPAEQLLGERFARGEIDEDEYRRRLTVLRDHTGGGRT